MARPNEQIRRLLARTSFGTARPDDIDAFIGRSYGESVERLLNSVSARPFSATPDWLVVPFIAQLEQNLPQEKRDAMQMERREDSRELKAWWFSEMLKDRKSTRLNSSH